MILFFLIGVSPLLLGKCNKAEELPRITQIGPVSSFTCIYFDKDICNFPEWRNSVRYRYVIISEKGKFVSKGYVLENLPTLQFDDHCYKWNVHYHLSYHLHHSLYPSWTEMAKKEEHEKEEIYQSVKSIFIEFISKEGKLLAKFEQNYQN